MAFINAGYFPPNPDPDIGYCIPEAEAIAEYDPKLSLTNAMYVWWKIYKVRYTYNWFYDGGGTDIVYGSGSVVMDGGIQEMSNKICPQIIYYTCPQLLTFEYDDGETSYITEISDTVYLSIDSQVLKYVQINEDNSRQTLYNPYVNLSIIAAREGYGYGWETYTSQPDPAPVFGMVNFFGLWTQPIFLDNTNTGYSVSISLSVEEESQAK